MTQPTNHDGHPLRDSHRKPGPGLRYDPDFAYRNPGGYAAWALWRAADKARNTVGLLGLIGTGLSTYLALTYQVPLLWLMPFAMLIGGAVLAFMIDDQMHSMRDVIVDSNNRRTDAERAAAEEAKATFEPAGPADDEDEDDEPSTWADLLAEMDECARDHADDLDHLDRLDWPDGTAVTYSHGQASQRLMAHLSEQRRLIATVRATTTPQEN